MNLKSRKLIDMNNTVIKNINGKDKYKSNLVIGRIENTIKHLKNHKT